MEKILNQTDPCSSSSTRRTGGKGRKKIVIAQIPDKNKQQVTFSKRRSGMFKKAGELCVLCGVEIAIIIFSPGGKVFCFGHPNAEATMNRFLTFSMDQTLTQTGMGGQEAQIIQAYNRHYEQAMQELEKEKMKMKQKSFDDNNGGLGFWWEESVNVEAMAMEELLEYTAALEELRSMVRRVESVKDVSHC